MHEFMKRKQLPQFISSRWLPAWIKRDISEFLSWFVVKVNATKPFIPVIEEQLEKTNLSKIVNVDFKIGAGMESVSPFLKKGLTLTSEPISNFNTSEEGLYVFVNGFHQLPPDKASKMLQDIAHSRNPVVVVEGNNDSLWQIVGMTVFVPLTVLLTAFFVRPFRFSRIIFTYLIPILPVIIVVDGCIALLKLYNPKDLDELTSKLEVENYEWKSGKNDNGRGGKIIYLTGRAI